MNRCQKCQAELPAEARFCNKCGSPRVFADSKPITSTSTPEDLAKKIFKAIAPMNDTPLASLHLTRSIQPGVKRGPEAAKEGNKAPSEPAQPTLATRPDDKGAKTPTPKVSPDREGEKPKPTTLPPSIKVTILPEASHSPSTQSRSASRPEAVQPTVTPEASRSTPVTPKPTSQFHAPPTAKPDTAQSAVQPAPAKPDVAQPARQPMPLQSLQALRPATQAGTSANRLAPSKSDQGQTNTPTQTQGKPVPPGIVRPISVSSSSLPPASIAQPGKTESGIPGLIRPVGAAPSSKPATTSIPLAQPGNTQQTQGNNSLATPSHLAALAAKKPTPLPQQRITPPPIPTEKRALDISEQVTRKDAAILAQQLWSAPNNSMSPTIQRGEIIRTSTLPPQRRRSDNVDELPIELEDLPVDDLPTGRVATEPGRNSPSLAATSRVAEHWRNSWRDRQHAEAGPAVGVSRGQASVPTPLTSMQHSIARMRAIVLNKQQTQQSRNTNFGFWMTLFLMLCLIGGLSIYIISTFLTASSLGAAHIVHPGGTADPSLTVKGPQTSGVAIGQLLQLHGEHFDANDTITFFLDTTTKIMGLHGKPLSVQVNNAGRFDISLPVDLNWSVGTHLIQAQDTRTHQTAYVNIEVTLKAKPETSSPNLQLSTKILPFSAIFGEGNPNSQRITFTNTSGQQLQWSVTATADHNLSWLVIDQNQTDGTMGIDEQDTLNVGILTTGLVPSHIPYTGHILFIINGKELLTLPVQLTVQNPSIEMSFSPNPVIAHLGPNGTCGTTTTLTLINLSDETVTWTVKPDSNIASNIKFYGGQGKPIKVPGGSLYPAGKTDPSGQRIDIVVLTLQCSGAKPGMHYHVSIYANDQQSSTDVIIQ